MQVNGEIFEFSSLETKNITGLLKSFDLSPDRVAIELNGDVVKKANYSATALSESDIVEIVYFVGGGK